MPPAALALSALALVLGGVLKGATGAGAPVVAVPVIALFFDVETAIITMMLPNLLSNVVQGWRYRAYLPRGGFGALFAAGGLAGAVLGTVLLANAPPEVLLLMVSVVVFLYIAFRIAKPGWALPMPLARRIVLPVGLAGGILQGATGVSAPISVTFLNAVRLPRDAFIGTISLFFTVMTFAQLVALGSYGLLSPEGLGRSAIALGLILAAMPLGEALARRIPPAVFDKLILALLAVVATRILIGVVL
ncbi:sulfite exporter TauE/SafE family protein [Rhodobacteraceae bacterium ASV31]|nr:sulfite exporter TauE/SafE family protein [Anianabacter salinae]